MPVKIHARNIPSDRDPEIRSKALAKGTSPDFIERPGFLRCPRCQRCWPEDHFKPGHAAAPRVSPEARCQDCRAGLARANRQKAIRDGVCEANNCPKPVVRHYKCEEHAARAQQSSTERSREVLLASGRCTYNLGACGRQAPNGASFCPECYRLYREGKAAQKRSTFTPKAG